MLGGRKSERRVVVWGLDGSASVSHSLAVPSQAILRKGDAYCDEARKSAELQEYGLHPGQLTQ